MGQLGANAKGATAAVPWYLSGGVSAANCLAAYKPKGAVSLAASYDNIAAPGNGLADGTYDAAPGAAPDWSAAKGWFFTGGTKWLTTGITFLEGWTFLGRYYQGAANQFFCGAYSAPRGIAYALTTTQRQYWSGTYFYTLGVSPKGVAGVAGNLGYFNGLLDTTPMAAWGATIPVVFTIGRMGNFASAWWTGGCSAFAIYNTALTAPQILAISTAMQNIDNTTMVAFGDSITAGLNASDAAHRWANIVATTTGYTLVNAGAASTTLQNTVQNTVAVLGAAASGNGRDTYVARVCANYPGRVYILYGLNDLRLDDAAYTANLFETDLGEVIDGLTTAYELEAADIYIGSPPYVQDYTIGAPEWDGGSIAKHQAYTAKCAAVAAAKGCKYADVYQAMIDGGGASLLSIDGVHPNDAGHAIIAAAFLAAT